LRPVRLPCLGPFSPSLPLSLFLPPFPARVPNSRPASSPDTPCPCLIPFPRLQAQPGQARLGQQPHPLHQHRTTATCATSERTAPRSPPPCRLSPSAVSSAVRAATALHCWARAHIWLLPSVVILLPRLSSTTVIASPSQATIPHLPRACSASTFFWIAFTHRPYGEHDPTPVTSPHLNGSAAATHANSQTHTIRLLVSVLRPHPTPDSASPPTA
jgi:hypothetical protein